MRAQGFQLEKLLAAKMLAALPCNKRHVIEAAGLQRETWHCQRLRFAEDLAAGSEWASLARTACSSFAMPWTPSTSAWRPQSERQARRPSLLRLDSAIVQLLSKLKQCESFARRPKCSSRMSRPCNKGAKALRTRTGVVPVVPRGQSNAIQLRAFVERRHPLLSRDCRRRLRPRGQWRVALQGQRPHGAEWTQRCVLLLGVL